MSDSIEETSDVQLRSKVVYPPLPPTLQGGMSWKMLKYFGAGAILASVTIGSGETFMASRGGAIFGYGALWAILLASVAKCVQVYTAARHITLTGRHPIEDWARISKSIPWFLLILCAWCFPFLLSFLGLALGQIVNDMFGLADIDSDPEKFRQYSRYWATLATLVAAGLTLIQAYGVMEKVQTFVIGLLLLCIGIATFAVNPEWLSVLEGLFVPSTPKYPDWMLARYQQAVKDSAWVEITAIIGFIGGGTYDYLGYIGCLREKNWGAISAIPISEVKQISTDEDNITRGLKWLRPASIDVSVSFLCVFIFSVCFVVLGAIVLNPKQVYPRDGEMLTQQSEFLTRLHPKLLYLYYGGVFMAFWGTIYGAYEIYCRTVYECLRSVSRRVRESPPRNVFRVVLVYCGIGAILLSWITENPVSLIKFPSTVGGVLTCGFWCFGMVWLDRKSLPPALQMKKPLLAATLLSGLFLTAVGMKGFGDYAVGLFRNPDETAEAVDATALDTEQSEFVELK